MPHSDPEKRREYLRAYRQRPEVKERNRKRSLEYYWRRAVDLNWRIRRQIMSRFTARYRYWQRRADPEFMERRREANRRCMARKKARLLESKAQLDAMLAEEADKN